MVSPTTQHRVTRLRLRGWWAAVLLAAMTVGSLGCGEADLRLPVFPVRGQIHFKGQAPSGAFIALHPTSGPNPAAPVPRATVAPDGSFAFTTYDGHDGAPEGDYVLTVQWNRLVRQGPDVVGGPNVLPAKYASPTTSDIKISVAAAENQLKPIKLR